jgi:hypothetical protein
MLDALSMVLITLSSGMNTQRKAIHAAGRESRTLANALKAEGRARNARRSEWDALPSEFDGLL